MYKVGIAGATGYTGNELLQLIHRHPQLEVGWITSESSAGSRYAEIHAVPWEYPLITLAEGMERSDEADVVFLCLPHAASIEPVKAFVGAGKMVIDLSADFRLADKAVYEKWYNVEHTAPELIEQFVYGLCEINREQIKGARLIAVPGCYPTTVNLGLYPLAKAGWLGEKVIVDSKSGLTGAGRKAKLQFSYAEANENITPYSIGKRHRHIAEMELVLNNVNGHKAHRFTFSPHLLPTNRGILSTMYVDIEANGAGPVGEEDIRGLYSEAYANEPFIHVLPKGEIAALRHTVHTNRCAISITPVDPNQADGTEYIITASEDNLLKGASGQAIQNFNIAMDIEETTGLL